MEKVATYKGWKAISDKETLRRFKLNAPIVIGEQEYHCLQVIERTENDERETVAYGMSADKMEEEWAGDQLYAWEGHDWRGIVWLGLGYEIRF